MIPFTESGYWQTIDNDFFTQELRLLITGRGLFGRALLQRKQVQSGARRLKRNYVANVGNATKAASGSSMLDWEDPFDIAISSYNHDWRSQSIMPKP